MFEEVWGCSLLTSARGRIQPERGCFHVEMEVVTARGQTLHFTFLMSHLRLNLCGIVPIKANDQWLYITQESNPFNQLTFWEPAPKIRMRSYPLLLTMVGLALLSHAVIQAKPVIILK